MPDECHSSNPLALASPVFRVHTSRSAWRISTFGGTQKAQTPLKPWWLIFDPEKGLINPTASDVMCAKGRTGIKILGNARFLCTKNKSEWMRWMWRHLTLTRRFKFLPFGVGVVNLSSRRETRIGWVCVSRFPFEKCWLFDWNLNLFCQPALNLPFFSLRSGLISFEVDLKVGGAEKMPLLEI